MKHIPLLLFLALNVAFQLDSLESDVICYCGCYKLLKNCECEAAEQMRGQITDMINAGMGREDVIRELQKMYGPEILATPPKEGFFTALWMYPLIAVGVGAVIIYVLLRRKNSTWFHDPDEVINLDIEKEDGNQKDER